MTQTIRFAYEDLTTPNCKLFLAGVALGEVAGYTPVRAGGTWSFTVADGLVGEPASIILYDNGIEESSDFVYLSGDADSVAFVGVHPAGNDGAAPDGTELNEILVQDAEGNPVPSAEVFITTDIAGTILVWQATANYAGIVQVFLEPGDYFVFRTHPLYLFTNPVPITIPPLA